MFGFTVKLFVPGQMKGTIAFLEVETWIGAAAVERRWVRAQSSPFLSPATSKRLVWPEIGVHRV
jgi:hypothetical protein